MLRITEAAGTERAVTLRLEGRLVADWVAVLEAECRPRLETGETVRLDLTDVVSTDGDGLRALRALRARGVTLLDTPPFLTGRLDVEDLP